MADIELDDLAHRRNRADVLKVEAMPRMHLESEARTESRAGVQPLELDRALRARGLRVRARVQLDRRHADARGGLDLPGLGVDEQRHADATLAERHGGLGDV